jgi:Putative metallopeptidase
MQQCYRFWQTIFLVSLLLLLTTFSSCRRGTPGTVQTEPANQTANSQSPDTTGQAAVDKGDLKLRYQAPQKTSAAKAHTVGSNPQAIEKVISELNQRLILPFDMVISFEDCGQPDAFYDPEKHQITLCHQLIDEYYDLFARKIKDKAKLDDAVRSATAATFFHELGHGLVDAWKIPITGREEDAVDQLSTLVLIQATENGEQMALEGALSFKLYADLTRGEKKIYWDEHSLDEQRFFDTVCLVYGHDEEKFAYLVKNGTLPEERAEFCAEDYDKLNHSWRQLLAPYLKEPAQSRPKLKLR